MEALRNAQRRVCRKHDPVKHCRGVQRILYYCIMSGQFDKITIFLFILKHFEYLISRSYRNAIRNTTYNTLRQRQNVSQITFSYLDLERIICIRMPSGFILLQSQVLRLYHSICQLTRPLLILINCPLTGTDPVYLEQL